MIALPNGLSNSIKDETKLVKHESPSQISTRLYNELKEEHFKIEVLFLFEVLKSCKGNKKQAAVLTGLSRATFFRKIRQAKEKGII